MPNYYGLLAGAINSPQGRRDLLGTAADPTAQTPQAGVPYRAVPWQQWTDVTVTSKLIGARDFLGTVPVSALTSSQRYQIVNNCDGWLFVSSFVTNASQLTNYPEAVIGPFQSLNVNLRGTGLNLLARVCGYDFTSARNNVSTFDVRFSNMTFVEVIPLGPSDNPPLPVLRSSWVRLYDKNDLTNGNAAPSSMTVGNSWFSNVVELAGATSVDMQAHVQASVATTGNFEFGLVGTAIDTGDPTANFFQGGYLNTLGLGHNYLQSSVTHTINRPQIELFFPAGDTSGATITIGDFWIMAVCHS